MPGSYPNIIQDINKRPGEISSKARRCARPLIDDLVECSFSCSCCPYFIGDNLLRSTLYNNNDINSYNNNNNRV